MNIKLFIISILLIGGLGGCCKKNYILQPTEKSCPTFNIEHFDKAQDYNLTLELKDSNIIIDKNNMLGYIEHNKNIKENYKLILKLLKDYNNNIKELNQEDIK